MEEKDGYSYGEINLKSKTTLYINVGGEGVSANKGKAEGGYNGGGSTYPGAWASAASGGGATHIAMKSGLLEELSENKDMVLIVAGRRSVAQQILIVDLLMDGYGGGEKGESVESLGYQPATGGTQESAGVSGKIKGTVNSAKFGHGGELVSKVTLSTAYGRSEEAGGYYGGGYGGYHCGRCWWFWICKFKLFIKW